MFSISSVYRLHLDQLKTQSDFYRRLYPHISIPEEIPTVTNDIITAMVVANEQKQRVFWFGEDFHVSGIPNTYRHEHLIAFSKPAIRPIPFLAMYRGLNQKLRDALVADPVAQHVFHAAVERILSSQITAGNLDQARQITEQWYELNPHDSRATALKAELLAAEDQREEAERLMEQVIHQKPVHLQVAKTYCSLLEARQAHKEIVDFLSDKRFLLANSGEITHALVRAYLALGDFQQAHQLIDQHPMASALIPIKAEVLFKSGDPVSATHLLESRLDENPQDIGCLQQRIYFAVAEGDQAALTKWVGQLAEVLPDHPLALEYERQLMGHFLNEP